MGCFGSKSAPPPPMTSNDTNSEAGLKSEDALALLKTYGPNEYKKKDSIPMPVTVVRDGRLRPLMPTDLVPGDVVYCTEGQLVLADVVIISFGVGVGEVIISDAHLTYMTGGEQTKSKKIGDKLFYGTVICGGSLYVRVEKTGKNTAIRMHQKNNKEKDGGGFGGKFFDTKGGGWFKKDVGGNKEIPGSVDPVLNYHLPPLREFLDDATSAKHFRRAVEAMDGQVGAIDCLKEVEKFKRGPSGDLAKEIYDKFVSDKSSTKLNFNDRMVQAIEADVAATEKKATTAGLDNLLKACLEILMPSWSSFRTRPEFNDWLQEAKNTSIDQLQKNWWKKYKNTKWGHTGKKASPDARAKAWELDGNAIKTPSHLPGNKKALKNQYLMVFWPVDNVSRLCHILDYDPDADLYQVTYFFDGKLYDEHLDSDWKIIELTKEAALDFRHSTGDPTTTGGTNNDSGFASSSSYGQ